jgi:RHS repeat-associated protein
MKSPTIKQKRGYDNLGRQTQQIDAYTDGVPTNNTNRTTNWTFDGNDHLVQLEAVLVGGYQKTQWVYGASKANGSLLDSNDLLREVRYPDKVTGEPSDPKDPKGPANIESLTYNALGQVKSRTDRNQTVHDYTFDVVSRMTADAITLAVDNPHNVDGRVQRLETAFDSAGRPFKFTSFDTKNKNAVVNDVEREFNGLGQLTAEYQNHFGAVDKKTTPKVGYVYSEGDKGANHSRMTALVYPGSTAYPTGRTLNYVYAGQDDTISRLGALTRDGVTLEQYTYLGLGSVVERAHPQPGVNLSYIHATAGGDSNDVYQGLDRFERVVDHRWVTAAKDDIDRFKYGYDRNSNRLFRENTVRGDFSELYHQGGPAGGYDPLNQVTGFKRGIFNAAKNDIDEPTRSQSWTHDAQGNWSLFTTDQTEQTRDHNRQNQITSIAGKNTPLYDANGNMSLDEAGRILVYDAWNRLAGVVNVVGYEHDAIGRRIEEHTGVIKDLYYSSDWQVLEEQEDGKLKAEYVWSQVYVDALVLRGRDVDKDGILDERLYAQQDANWNVTALVNDKGILVERYVYDPYGAVTVLDANWNPKSLGGYDWRHLHQGGRFDVTTGLYHFRNRDYSPTLGRWMQRDPIEFAGGDTNLYGYVHNGPTSRVDPSGLKVMINGDQRGPIELYFGAGNVTLEQLSGGRLRVSVTEAGLSHILAYARRTGGNETFARNLYAAARADNDITFEEVVNGTYRLSPAATSAPPAPAAAQPAMSSALAPVVIGSRAFWATRLGAAGVACAADTILPIGDVFALGILA